MERLKLMKIDMRFGTCNISSFYRAGSLRTVARQLAKHELVIFKGIQEVRRDRGGTEPEFLWKWERES